MPLDRFAPSNFISCEPEFSCRFIKTDISFPEMSNTFNLTKLFSGRSYLITVDGLNGFGKFCFKLNFLGASFELLLMPTSPLELEIKPYCPDANETVAETNFTLFKVIPVISG